MAEIFVNHSTVAGACGVGVVDEFDNFSFYDDDRGSLLTKNEGGAGWLCAGFVYKNKLCNEVFKQLSGKYKLVFKTRVRKNLNSGNKFYFAVFDTHGTGIPTGYKECDAL